MVSCAIDVDLKSGDPQDLQNENARSLPWADFRRYVWILAERVNLSRETATCGRCPPPEICWQSRQ